MFLRLLILKKNIYNESDLAQNYQECISSFFFFFNSLLKNLKDTDMLP